MEDEFINRSGALTPDTQHSESRRTSILKPPKPRLPLQELPYFQNENEHTATSTRSRTSTSKRVSFAVSQVKEFRADANVFTMWGSSYYEDIYRSSDSSHQTDSSGSDGHINPPEDSTKFLEDSSHGTPQIHSSCSDKDLLGYVAGAESSPKSNLRFSNTLPSNLQKDMLLSHNDPSPKEETRTKSCSSALNLSKSERPVVNCSDVDYRCLPVGTNYSQVLRNELPIASADEDNDNDHCKPSECLKVFCYDISPNADNICGNEMIDQHGDASDLDFFDMEKWASDNLKCFSTFTSAVGNCDVTKEKKILPSKMTGSSLCSPTNVSPKSPMSNISPSSDMSPPFPSKGYFCVRSAPSGNSALFTSCNNSSDIINRVTGGIGIKNLNISQSNNKMSAQKIVKTHEKNINPRDFIRGQSEEQEVVSSKPQRTHLLESSENAYLSSSTQEGVHVMDISQMTVDYAKAPGKILQSNQTKYFADLDKTEDMPECTEVHGNVMDSSQRSMNYTNAPGKIMQSNQTKYFTDLDRSEDMPEFTEVHGVVMDSSQRGMNYTNAPGKIMQSNQTKYFTDFDRSEDMIEATETCGIVKDNSQRNMDYTKVPGKILQSNQTKYFTDFDKSGDMIEVTESNVVKDNLQRSMDCTEAPGKIMQTNETKCYLDTEKSDNMSVLTEVGGNILSRNQEDDDRVLCKGNQPSPTGKMELVTNQLTGTLTEGPDVHFADKKKSQLFQSMELGSNMELTETPDNILDTSWAKHFQCRSSPNKSIELTEVHGKIILENQLDRSSSEEYLSSDRSLSICQKQPQKSFNDKQTQQQGCVPDDSGKDYSLGLGNTEIFNSSNKSMELTETPGSILDSNSGMSFDQSLTPENTIEFPQACRKVLGMNEVEIDRMSSNEIQPSASGDKIKYQVFKHTSSGKQQSHASNKRRSTSLENSRQPLGSAKHIKTSHNSHASIDLNKTPRNISDVSKNNNMSLTTSKMELTQSCSNFLTGKDKEEIEHISFSESDQPSYIDDTMKLTPCPQKVIIRENLRIQDDQFIRKLNIPVEGHQYDEEVSASEMDGHNSDKSMELTETPGNIVDVNWTNNGELISPDSNVDFTQASGNTIFKDQTENDAQLHTIENSNLIPCQMKQLPKNTGDVRQTQHFSKKIRNVSLDNTGRLLVSFRNTHAFNSLDRNIMDITNVSGNIIDMNESKTSDSSMDFTEAYEGINLKEAQDHGLLMGYGHSTCVGGKINETQMLKSHFSNKFRNLSEENTPETADNTRTFTNENAPEITDNTRTFTNQNASEMVVNTRTFTNENASQTVDNTRTFTNENASEKVGNTRTFTNENSSETVDNTRTFINENDTGTVDNTRTFTDENASGTADNTRTFTDENAPGTGDNTRKVNKHKKDMELTEVPENIVNGSRMKLGYYLQPESSVELTNTCENIFPTNEVDFVHSVSLKMGVQCRVGEKQDSHSLKRRRTSTVDHELLSCSQSPNMEVSKISPNASQGIHSNQPLSRGSTLEFTDAHVGNLMERQLPSPKGSRLHRMDETKLLPSFAEQLVERCSIGQKCQNSNSFNSSNKSTELAEAPDNVLAVDQPKNPTMEFTETFGNVLDRSNTFSKDRPSSMHEYNLIGRDLLEISSSGCVMSSITCMVDDLGSAENHGINILESSIKNHTLMSQIHPDITESHLEDSQKSSLDVCQSANDSVQFTSTTGKNFSGSQLIIGKVMNEQIAINNSPVNSNPALITPVELCKGENGPQNTLKADHTCSPINFDKNHPSADKEGSVHVLSAVTSHVAGKTFEIDVSSPVKKKIKICDSLSKEEKSYNKNGTGDFSLNYEKSGVSFSSKNESTLSIKEANCNDVHRYNSPISLKREEFLIVEEPESAEGSSCIVSTVFIDNAESNVLVQDEDKSHDSCHQESKMLRENIILENSVSSICQDQNESRISLKDELAASLDKRPTSDECSTTIELPLLPKKALNYKQLALSFLDPTESNDLKEAKQTCVESTHDGKKRDHSTEPMSYSGIKENRTEHLSHGRRTEVSRQTLLEFTMNNETKSEKKCVNTMKINVNSLEEITLEASSIGDNHNAKKICEAASSIRENSDNTKKEIHEEATLIMESFSQTKEMSQESTWIGENHDETKEMPENAALIGENLDSAKEMLCEDILIGENCNKTKEICQKAALIGENLDQPKEKLEVATSIEENLEQAKEIKPALMGENLVQVKEMLQVATREGFSDSSFPLFCESTSPSETSVVLSVKGENSVSHSVTESQETMSRKQNSSYIDEISERILVNSSQQHVTSDLTDKTVIENDVFIPQRQSHLGSHPLGQDSHCGYREVEEKGNDSVSSPSVNREKDSSNETCNLDLSCDNQFLACKDDESKMFVLEFLGKSSSSSMEHQSETSVCADEHCENVDMDVCPMEDASKELSTNVGTSVMSVPPIQLEDKLPVREEKVQPMQCENQGDEWEENSLQNHIRSSSQRKGCLWKIKHLSDQEINLEFLNGTLHLVITLECDKISSVNLVSNITAENNSIMQLAHLYLKNKLTDEHLSEICLGAADVSNVVKLLEHSVKYCLEFMNAFEDLQFTDTAETNGRSVTFDIANLEMHRWFYVTVDLSRWAGQRVRPENISVKNMVGRTNQDEVRMLMKAVPVGPLFLQDFAKQVHWYVEECLRDLEKPTVGVLL